MTSPLYIAVDLGAGSGRVFVASVDTSEFLLKEVHRFQYPPAESAGHLRWNLPRIFDNICEGLQTARRYKRELNRPIQSIGVDSWGVDYGLIDDRGRLIEDPVCYRDERTLRMMETVFARVPRAEIFERTGIQFMPFNTLFQMYAHTEEGLPAAARTQLLIPDLINFLLTGARVTEYTNATTTQMVNARSSEWDRQLLEKLNLPSELLPPIVPAGTIVGRLRAELADELELDRLLVVAPATHDTGSAVAGAPLADGWAYISSGTWSLVGVEREQVLINEGVARHNFTNEGGAFGTIRFLKNVMGLWILESCRKEWQQEGVAVDYDVLLREVAAIPGCAPLIFPDDERFFNPREMLTALADQLRENGEAMPSNPPAIAKIILDSLAFRYASVLRTIESLTQSRIAGVQIIGGGSQNDYLNQVTANVTGLQVSAGPVEATVIGNVLVQAIAQGHFVSLADARGYLAEHVDPRRYVPVDDQALIAVRLRYEQLEARHLARLNKFAA